MPVRLAGADFYGYRTCAQRLRSLILRELSSIEWFHKGRMCTVLDGDAFHEIRGTMPAKTATRKLHTLSPGRVSNIPTTIKNPERVAHRRTELIDVATKMFLERGFHNTSIRDIVRACSFNVASLYMYVSSMEDILYLVEQVFMNNIAQKLLESLLTSAST